MDGDAKERRSRSGTVVDLDRELKQWLQKSNCHHYLQKFIDNGITYDLIPELDTNALREIGVNKLGDRVRLEIAISSMKGELLSNHISVEELYRILDMNSEEEVKHEVLDESSTLIQSLNIPNDNTKDANKNVTFILPDGTTKKVNVTGCFNAQSIKRKVLKKLGIRQQEANYDTYVHTQNKLSLLYDVELVTICYSPERLEKFRILLCRKDEPPSELAVETSKKIMTKYEKFELLKRQNALSQYHIPDPQKQQLTDMRKFFGQRPPSELISSNLAEYFPEAPQKQLEATVRNSVRYSVRLSKRFNLPSSANGSVTNFGHRQLIMSSYSEVARSPSLSSNDTLQKRAFGRTIGDVMMNNITAIDEAVGVNDAQLLFSKPPSIRSDLNDDKSIKSGSSAFKRRFSVAASFSDHNNPQDNRYSRIELFSIDSDDEEDDENTAEDFIAQYGNYSTGELNHYSPLKKWLQGARIGAGSFGTVYLGMDPFTGELMAVKQVALPKENSINKELQKSVLEALEREMTLLQELNHDNIVRYLGSSIDETYLNIFLEYVPGGSVQSMLTSYGPFEEPLIRNFIRQVLIGLSYLHGEDIIHRDIKGANILIDIKGTVKISDFGISKKVTSSSLDSDDEPKGKSSRRASLQGSVYWMAPEVVKQTAYTKKADIWSVGCLIVEMFTGKHPFPNFSQMQAIFKIGTHIKPLIPEWCTMEAKDFLVKTFELEYEKRPDAVDMLAEPFLNPLIMSKQ